MKIVLDTNVLISGFLFPGGSPDKIVRAVLSGRYQNATSPDLLTELRRIFRKKFELAEDRVETLVKLVVDASELVYPTERLDAIKDDETDNRVLECAVTAKAEWIVSGDQRHLLKLRKFGAVEIFSPADFIQKVGI